LNLEYQETSVKTSALHRNPAEYLNSGLTDFRDRDAAERRFSPLKVEVAGPAITTSTLRMYTEEEVAGILQVSLSQLRKWRMKQHIGKQQGPPFKKVGRLVRYPQKALQAYIDGD
jgi:Helix-turn-helix domain